MPRVPTKPPTPEERLAKRRAQAADRAQTETVRTEHKVPVEERTCPSCGNEKLKPIGNGRTTTVFEFAPARFVRHEHVQEVLRCRCGDYVVTAPGAPKVIEKGRYGASLLAHLAVAKVCGPPAALPPREGLRAARLPDRSIDDERSAASDERA